MSEMDKLFVCVEEIQAMVDIAALTLWEFYHALLKRGFSTEQAFTLTRDTSISIFNRQPTKVKEG